MTIHNLQGKTLGQYQLTRLIGKGGMAVVYRAHQESLRRDVAVKVLPLRLAESDATYIERFNQEARTIARLEHAHIVPIYDYATENEITYVVMRLLEGGTLSDLMRNRYKQNLPPLELSVVADWLSRLAGALDYAHSENIIHRDIKPSNIMFDRHETPFLVDFGIVKLLDNTNEDLTSDDITPGTPRYMAPEQWRGDPVTAATDQYALAVVIYLMLAGEAPFDAPTRHGLMYQHLERVPPPLHEERDDINPAVSDVLARALAKDPADRYPSVKAFARAMRQVVSPEFQTTSELKIVQTDENGQSIEDKKRTTSNIFEIISSTMEIPAQPDGASGNDGANPAPAEMTFRPSLNALMPELADASTQGFFLVSQAGKVAEIARYVQTLPEDQAALHEEARHSGYTLKMTLTTVAAQRSLMAHPEYALWTVPVLRNGDILYDRDGGLAKLKQAAENWQPDPRKNQEHINGLFASISGEVRNIIVDVVSPVSREKPDEFYQQLAMGLMGTIAVHRTILIDEEAQVVPRLLAEMGPESKWSQWLEVTLGKKTVPRLPARHMRSIALLNLYKETAYQLRDVFDATTMQMIEQTIWAIENVLAQF